MRTPEIPRGARSITTYAEFVSYLRDFAAGREPFMWIVGRPGLSKSQSIKAATVGKKVRLYKGGQLTPASFFMDCYKHRGEPIILDDAEHLLDYKLGLKLVLALCETDKVKQMDYGTSNKFLREAGVPATYFTNSPLCIIANRTTSHAAVMSRASALLHFAPTNLEVHQSVAGWFWDQEIHDWIGTHLSQLEAIDVRWYVHAAKDKNNKRDWRKILLDAHSVDADTVVIQDLEADHRCFTVKEKEALFTQRTGKCRATYFNRKTALEAAGQLTPNPAPIFVLSANKPPAEYERYEIEAMTRNANLDRVEAPEPVVGPPDLPAPTVREEFSGGIRGARMPDAAPPRWTGHATTGAAW